MKAKIFSAISWVITLGLLSWMFLSFVEINIKNKEPNPQYSEANFYLVLEDIVENWKD